MVSLINDMFCTMYPSDTPDTAEWWHKQFAATSWYRHRWARNKGHTDHVDVKLCRTSRGTMTMTRDSDASDNDTEDEVPSITVPVYDSTIRVEFNPNKLCVTNPSALKCVSALCCLDHAQTYIRRADLAVDVPNVKPDDFLVASRKRKGKYETTRYFGKSLHDGYLKIYDKQVESNLVSALTRVEYTMDEGGSVPFDTDKVRYVTHGPEPLPDISTLTTLQRKYVDAFNRISVYDRDSALEWLESIDYRTQQKLEPYTYGTGIRLITDSDSRKALEYLLPKYCEYFHCTANLGGVKSTHGKV